jgi:hypothetical protein
VPLVLIFWGCGTPPVIPRQLQKWYALSVSDRQEKNPGDYAPPAHDHGLRETINKIHMKQGQSIQIRLVAETGESIHLSNVEVQVNFFVYKNFRYGFKAGRTDQLGLLRVSYADVETLRRRDSAQNLMDYNTKLEECDPVVEIVVPSEVALREQYNNAMRGYKRPPAWAKNWPSNAQLKATPRKIELGGPLTEVGIVCKPAGG